MKPRTGHGGCRAERRMTDPDRHASRVLEGCGSLVWVCLKAWSRLQDPDAGTPPSRHVRLPQDALAEGLGASPAWLPLGKCTWQLRGPLAGGALVPAPLPGDPAGTIFHLLAPCSQDLGCSVPSAPLPLAPPPRANFSVLSFEAPAPHQGS